MKTFIIRGRRSSAAEAFEPVPTPTQPRPAATPTAEPFVSAVPERTRPLVPIPQMPRYESDVRRRLINEVRGVTAALIGDATTTSGRPQYSHLRDVIQQLSDTAGKLASSDGAARSEADTAMAASSIATLLDYGQRRLDKRASIDGRRVTQTEREAADAGIGEDFRADLKTVGVIWALADARSSGPIDSASTFDVDQFTSQMITAAPPTYAPVEPVRFLGADPGTVGL